MVERLSIFGAPKIKKEVDFILKEKNKMIPVEAKISFESFKGGNIKYFLDKYKGREYIVVGLKGEKNNQIGYSFPWEL